MYGSMIPSWRLPGATASATGAPARRGSSTTGRRALASRDWAVSSTSHSSRAAATSATISANGLSSRCLRARSAAAASWLPASTARWYPPSPLTASTRPPASSAAAPASGSTAIPVPRAPSRRSRGPQAGQQTGWAWNLRFAGSWYSASHCPHMRNGAMVVSGRSYGTPVTMVNRGPQLVQLMKGYA